MKFLLDSNALVCALNDTGGVRGRLNDAQSSGATILTSAVVVGDIKAALRRRGLAKGDADPQIAATAVVEDATLVTDDRALLDASIPRLSTENWIRRGAGT